MTVDLNTLPPLGDVVQEEEAKTAPATAKPRRQRPSSTPDQARSSDQDSGS
jgi:hypothetical protein